MSFLGPLPHFEQVLRLPDLVIEFQDVETVETGNKNRCATEASHVSWRKLRFSAFPDRVSPRILSLESVDFFETSEHFSGREKKNEEEEEEES